LRLIKAAHGQLPKPICYGTFAQPVFASQGPLGLNAYPAGG
jgi:hypothetical protein